LILGLTGMFLTSHGMGPNWKTAPQPKEPPPWVMRASIASGLFTVIGTLLFWVTFHVPWATMLLGWILICVSTGAIMWLYSRSLRQQPPAEPGVAPDQGRM
jgi:hypothetical protein